MIPVAVAVIFGGYTIGIWGFCLFRDYNVTFADLFRPAWPGGSSGSATKPGGSNPGGRPQPAPQPAPGG